MNYHTGFFPSTSTLRHTMNDQSQHKSAAFQEPFSHSYPVVVKLGLYSMAWKSGTDTLIVLSWQKQAALLKNGKRHEAKVMTERKRLVCKKNGRDDNLVMRKLSLY